MSIRPGEGGSVDRCVSKLQAVQTTKRAIQMQIKGATTVLEKQCEFLGMKWDDLIKSLEKSPLIHNNQTIRAFKVYKQHNRRMHNGEQTSKLF